MNRFYIITPLVFMLLFGGIYWKHSQTSAVEKQKIEAHSAQVAADEAAKKEAAVIKARDDSAKRAAARLAEEEQKEAEKRSRWTAAGDKIAADIAANKTLIAKHTEAIATLEAELEAARTAKNKLNDKAFTLNHEIEGARIAKRNTEFEIQRMTEMVARKAAGTSLAAMP